jgi:hypothetical protein
MKNYKKSWLSNHPRTYYIIWGRSKRKCFVPDFIYQNQYTNGNKGKLCDFIKHLNKYSLTTSTILFNFAH